MWWAADQIVSSYRVFPLFVSLAQAMREVNKIKQNKTPERLSTALHCGVGSLMSNVPPTEQEEETSSRRHWSEIWRGVYCNVSWHLSQCTRKVIGMEKLARAKVAH